MDVFEKEFLFLPVNLFQHWSLAVVCNPGVEDARMIFSFYFSKKRCVRASKSFLCLTYLTGAIDDDNLEPFVIHMDSMKDGHDSKQIGQHLCK